MSDATKIVPQDFPKQITPKAIPPRFDLEEALRSEFEPSLLGVSLLGCGSACLLTAPGYLFDPGERWRIASLDGDGFVEDPYILINRGEFGPDPQRSLATIIGEIVLHFAGIQGGRLPAMPAFVPEGQDDVVAEGFPVMSVPADCWSGCWGNRSGYTGEADTEFSLWYEEQRPQTMEGGAA